jgi:hypothetical protein
MNFAPDRASAATDFNQIAQCLAYLRSVNVNDPDAAAEKLATLLEGMAVASPPPSAHLQMLEDLRQSLDFVVTELARRYASHPLPPLSSEQTILHQVVRLWLLMGTNYGFVGQRFTLNAGTIPEEQRALLQQRRVYYQTRAMMEFFRARQELPRNMWRDLHGLFQAAQRAGLAASRVPDALNDTWGAQSPLECYVAMLLVDASSPYSRTPREFSWILRWAQRFAPYCSLENSAGAEAHSYLLEMEADHGLRPAGTLAAPAQAYCLQTVKLAAHIQTLVKKLKAGEAPTTLGLGDDCVQPACARLLISLYRPWGKATAGRKFPRRVTQGRVRLCADLNGAAFFLLGHKFEMPDEDRTRYTSFIRTDRILGLDERVEEAASAKAELLEIRARQQGYVVEPWEVLDQSVAGFRLACREPAIRVEHRQLIGLLPGQTDRLFLAEISWLQYQRDGALCTGISLMPGPPHVVAVRPCGIDRTQVYERFRLGFVLPEVPALKTEVTLIVPAGLFAEGRLLDVHDEQPWTARLLKLVSRGSNFDRATFERVVSGALPGSVR